MKARQQELESEFDKERQNFKSKTAEFEKELQKLKQESMDIIKKKGWYAHRLL